MLFTNNGGNVTTGVSESAQDYLPLQSTKVFPNPTYKTATVEFELTQESYADLSIYNTNGSFVEKLNTGQYFKGVNQIKIDISNLPIGVYFLKLETNRIFELKKIILIH